MGWQTVFICEEHWKEQGGKPVALPNLPPGVEIVSEPCYLCQERAFIPVRREIGDTVQGGSTCEHCDNEGVVRVNGTWLCLDHLDSGFKQALGPIKQLGQAFLNSPDDAA